LNFALWLARDTCPQHRDFFIITVILASFRDKKKFNPQTGTFDQDYLLLPKVWFVEL
jgi:hypothetical protein